jgi:adenylate cyclase
MDRAANLVQWLVSEGRFLANNAELLPAFCERLVAAGVPVSRAWLHIRALHPQFGGVSRDWRPGHPLEQRYFDHGIEKTEVYLNSPVRYAVERRATADWRLDGPGKLPFPALQELRAAGYVHYAVAPLVFSDGVANAISWATEVRDGFSRDDLALLEAVLPAYSALVELKSLRRFARNMLATYVGRAAGELILQGQIRRGDVRTIRAALMLVDLRDFTALSDAMPPAAVVEMLNRYYDCVMRPVVERGGEIMEIMGDGILAIFNDRAEHDPHDACRLAFDAATAGLAALEAANRMPGATGPELHAGFALHYGTVSYGNIGSDERLDFTVIGPDVNLTARIERLCRELDRTLIMSAEFAARLDRPMFAIGHFRLRGFSRMQMLYGLPAEDEAATPPSRAVG